MNEQIKRFFKGYTDSMNLPNLIVVLILFNVMLFSDEFTWWAFMALNGFFFVITWLNYLTWHFEKKKLKRTLKTRNNENQNQ